MDKSVQTARDKLVRRKFPAVARVLWDKPDAVIATIDGCSDRNARRILRGELPVPASVLLAACEEMLRPLG